MTQKTVKMLYARWSKAEVTATAKMFYGSIVVNGLSSMTSDVVVIIVIRFYCANDLFKSFLRMLKNSVGSNPPKKLDIELCQLWKKVKSLLLAGYKLNTPPF